MVGAGLIVYEGTSYASTKPIRKPEDIAGLKIRVLASPVERAIPGAWGGTGVPMNFTEVVPAMQRGVVDACRSSIVAMTGLKFQTVAKFTTVSGGGYIPTATWYSKAWLNKLPADIRKMALEIPGELEEEVAEAVRNKVAASHKIWEEAGVELIRFSDADQKRYLAKLRPLGEEILGKHKNPLVRDLYGKLKIVAERHRPEVLTLVSRQRERGRPVRPLFDSARHAVASFDTRPPGATQDEGDLPEAEVTFPHPE